MSQYLSWVEKYRPTLLDDIRGHNAIKKSFRYYIKSKQMPNVLLSGPPGCGKTTLIHCFANEIYGSEKSANFREWNSSNDRGIDIVRGEIKQASEYGAKGNYPWKLLYLGEIDGMTHQAQDALKRTMETSYRNVRFIADCNNLGRIIPAIQSRFCHFKVKPVETQHIRDTLKDIIKKEELTNKIDDDTILDYIATKKDMRNCIQFLEGLAWDDTINIDLVKELAPTPSNDVLLNLLENLKTISMQQQETLLNDLIRDNPSADEIINMIFKYYENKNNVDWDILSLVADYEIRIQQGNPIHQLRTLLYILKQKC